ncbi:hypothetical protein EUQ05_20370 [Salmonella enterica subsp. enterica serovar Saintpaul]|nr:hypothetical protein [Salmonella enterica subsp. enterica serovar Saintpaul]ECA9824380.1 hypothetical protein [Salmonella enterica subsp. enterica serovar Saintpaul]EKD2447506.1 hypothetical protein [Salmonella enterica]
MNMRKTLIALAVVSGAFISGNVMASDWTPNGTGGSVELGGTLTPVDKTTPWSVKVGGGVSDLNAQIVKDQNVVSIPVVKPILFLGIAPTDGSFWGRKGITPQIDYNGAIDLDKFSNGVTKIKLPVKDKEQNSIGYMEAGATAVGGRLWKENNSDAIFYQAMYADEPGYGFYGGVAKSADGLPEQDVNKALVEKLDPEITKSMWHNNYWAGAAGRGLFETEHEYQGYYGSGLMDTEIKITLDTPPKGDDSFEWHASLPVVVSYQ